MLTKMKLLLPFILLLSLGFSLFGQTYGQKIVAAVLVAEAGIDGIKGMTAVAEVIRNRADERGTTMLAEVQRRGQFTPVVAHGSVDAVYKKFYLYPQYPEALKIARIAYNTPEKLAGLTGGATYYHEYQIRPYWIKGLARVATVGRHYFYISSKTKKK
jgi:spore germination cell wall hydrolase CwlJ-like protein